MEPRTISGRAAISAMRPHVKRALGATIAAIETEAAAPYREALARATAVLERIAAMDPTADWQLSTRADLVGAAALACRAASLLPAAPPSKEPA